MGTYNLPRNVKGEGKILFVFSGKAMIYSVIGAGVGIVISWVLGLIGLKFVGYVIMGILALAGFIIGTFKVPETNAFEITRKTGGENIDDVIKRAIKFKMQKNKVYIYTNDESKIEKTEEKSGGDK